MPRLSVSFMAVSVLALILAGCSGGAVPSTTTSTTTTTATSTTSTSTTTTTLPVSVPGTAIMRVRVPALQPGTLVLPAISEGSAAWLKMVPIAYRSFGTGPNLLVIPGQDGTLSWWGPPLFTDLAAHYHVTVFDLPGAGYSGAPTAPLSLALAGGHDGRLLPHRRVDEPDRAGLGPRAAR